MDRRRKAQQRKRIDMIGIEQNRNGKEKTGGDEQGNGMAPNRYDRTRNGKAKIPRRRNPAERKKIWQSLKLEIELSW